MPTTNEIPYLIQLLDDESLTVQQQISDILATFSFDELQRSIKLFSIELNPVQDRLIKQLFEHQRRDWLRDAWPSWHNIQDEHEKLEKALTILAQFLNKTDEVVNLDALLSDLSETYLKAHKTRDPYSLARFLFEEYAIQGNKFDYYSPQNSNLQHVIQYKLGIPISLVCVYMLVGHRLGFDIQGCNFPGHFLARVEHDGQTRFIDCFSGGKYIKPSELKRLSHEFLKGQDQILYKKVDTVTIVRRYLANLIRSFQLQEDPDSGRVIVDMFKELDERLSDTRFIEISPEDIINCTPPKHELGQVVRHKRYGYRGIIVHVDSHCKATDEWYYGNQTQPERDQPWFHILVNASDQVTYVAQSSLVADDSQDLIVHPLLAYFFSVGENGRYVRNQNVWPETDF